MIWRSIVLGVLCGFSSVVLFYDAPTLYYQGLGFGLSWSYAVALSVWIPAGVVTVVLIALGCRRPGPPRRLFIASAVTAHIMIQMVGWAIGEHLRWPPTPGDVMDALFGSLLVSAISLAVICIPALSAWAIQKWVFSRSSTRSIAAPMTWRSVLIGVLFGFSSVLLFKGWPAPYSLGLSLGTPWSYEFGPYLWIPAGVVTALLVALGCWRPGYPRRVFIVAGVIAHIMIRWFGWIVGLGPEELPPTLGESISAFVELVPTSLASLVLIFAPAYVLAFLGGAVGKRLFAQGSTGSSE